MSGYRWWVVIDGGFLRLEGIGLGQRRFQAQWLVLNVGLWLEKGLGVVDVRHMWETVVGWL